MKAKLPAAIGFAVLLCIASCTLFSTKSKLKNLFAGKYEILNITDSITTKKWMPGDTLKWFFNDIKDSSLAYVNFGKDSLLEFKLNNNIDSVKYYSDSVNKIVYVKTDSSFHPYKIVSQSDSIINFFSPEDSIYIALKKL